MKFITIKAITEKGLDKKVNQFLKKLTASGNNKKNCIPRSTLLKFPKEKREILFQEVKIGFL